MSEFPPLGEYEQLRKWSGRAVPWGPDGQSSVSFGAGVVDHLAELIADGPRRVSDRYPGKAEAFTVTLGCVPWLTSKRVTAALMSAGAHCMCVDKSSQRSSAVRRLLAHGHGIANHFIPDLRFTGPVGLDGSPPIIGPSSFIDEEEGAVLEPIRVVGWRPQRGKELPLLHTKLAVICAAWHWERDVRGGWGGYEDYLSPVAAWWGSANWTEGARRHIEMGAWTTDEAFCGASLEFLVDVIRFSQAPTSDTAGPEPDLAPAEFDDIAFAEYAAEMEPWPDPDAEGSGGAV